METEEHLAAAVGKIKIGVCCHDVLNVYRQTVKVAPLVNQSDFFLGITNIANEIMPVIDLGKRIRVESYNQSSTKNVITFQTSLTKKFAVIVDEIIGMKSIKLGNIKKANTNLHNQIQNLNLLFPMVALMDDGSIFHILDSTYLDKIEPITQDSGDLELF